MGLTLGLSEPLQVNESDVPPRELSERLKMFLRLSTDPTVRPQDLNTWLEGQIRHEDGPINVNATQNEEHPFFENYPRTVIHLLAHATGDPVAIGKIRLLVGSWNAIVDARTIQRNEGNFYDEDQDEDDDDVNHVVTPLYVAVHRNNYDAVRELVELGANIERKHNHFAASPLMFVVVSSSDPIMAQVLLSCGASPHARDHNSGTIMNNTASVQCAELLAAMGADCNAFCSMCWSTLDFAYVRVVGEVVDEEEKLAMCRFLVANGANPRSRNADTQQTPALNCCNGLSVTSFLGRAEKWIKRWEEYCAASSDVERGRFPTQVKTLDRELRPFILTEARRERLRLDIYRQGLRYRDVRQWTPTAYMACLCIPHACKSITAGGKHLPHELVCEIIEFSMPIFSGFDARDDTVEDWEDSWLEDKPDDACSENGFVGGINAGGADVNDDDYGNDSDDYEDNNV